MWCGCVVNRGAPTEPHNGEIASRLLQHGLLPAAAASQHFMLCCREIFRSASDEELLASSPGDPGGLLGPCLFSSFRRCAFQQARVRDSPGATASGKDEPTSRYRRLTG